MKTLYEYFKIGAEQLIIDFLREYKFSDLMFIRGPADEYDYVDIILDQYYTFGSAKIYLSDFNILQYACLKGMKNVVGYILEEHKVMGSNR